MTQAQLGALLHIARPHMSEMCKGSRGIPIDRLDDFACALGVATYTLVLDDPTQWVGRRDRRKGERRSGLDRRQVSNLAKMH